MEVRRLQDSELYHFGIKGQKWGKRRYQNPDGSLTPEGRIHYGLNTKEGRERAIKSGDVKTIKAIRSELSEAEMKRAIEQIRINEQLNSFDKSTLSKGEQWIKTHKDTLLTITTVVGAAVTATANAEKIMNKITGKKSELDYWTEKSKIAAAKKTVGMYEDYLRQKGGLTKV